MASGPEIAARLYEHCLGAGDPSFALLEDGALPDGWVDGALDLLEQARVAYVDEPLWPRALVAVLHFLTRTLGTRYQVWHSTAHRHDSLTEQHLARLQAAAELFFTAAERPG